MDNQQQPTGPPYLPQTAPVGGIPTTSVDVPICTILLVLYLLGLLVHTRIYHHNSSSPPTKFRLSILVIYPCLLRLVTMALRIAWAVHTHNIRLAIAAQIFTTAGVLLLYILNIVFSQRIMRAWHPKFGWRPVVSWAFPVFYAMVPLSLVAAVVSFVQSLYTLDVGKRRKDVGVQRYGVVFFLVVAGFPIFFILINWLVFILKKSKLGEEEEKREDEQQQQNVERPAMKGNVKMSAALVVLANFILAVGAIFRMGTSFASPRPADNPAWYDSKACFYIFNFVPELVVIFLYAVLRVDKLFCIYGGDSTVTDNCC